MGERYPIKIKHGIIDLGTFEGKHPTLEFELKSNRKSEILQYNGMTEWFDYYFNLGINSKAILVAKLKDGSQKRLKFVLGDQPYLEELRHVKVRTNQ